MNDTFQPERPAPPTRAGHGGRQAAATLLWTTLAVLLGLNAALSIAGFTLPALLAGVAALGFGGVLIAFYLRGRRR